MGNIDIEKYIELANAEYEKNGASQEFNKLQDEIIKSINAIVDRFIKSCRMTTAGDELALELQKCSEKDFGLYLKRTREIQRDMGTIDAYRCIYDFAMNVENADISKLEDALIHVAVTLKDFCMPYINNPDDFITNYFGVDEFSRVIKRLVRCIYNFARNVKGARVGKLYGALIANFSDINWDIVIYCVDGYRNGKDRYIDFAAGFYNSLIEGRSNARIESSINKF